LPNRSKIYLNVQAYFTTFTEAITSLEKGQIVAVRRFLPASYNEKMVDFGQIHYFSPILKFGFIVSGVKLSG